MKDEKDGTGLGQMDEWQYILAALENGRTNLLQLQAQKKRQKGAARADTQKTIHLLLAQMSLVQEQATKTLTALAEARSESLKHVVRAAFKRFRFHEIEIEVTYAPTFDSALINYTLTIINKSKNRSFDRNMLAVFIPLLQARQFQALDVNCLFEDDKIEFYLIDVVSDLRALVAAYGNQ